MLASACAALLLLGVAKLKGNETPLLLPDLECIYAVRRTERTAAAPYVQI